MQRRERNIADITPARKVYQYTIKIGLIWLVMIVLGMMANFAEYTTLDDYQVYNQTAEQFNALTLAERQLILPYTDLEIDEDQRMTYYDVESAERTLEFLVTIWGIICALALIVLPCSVLYGYAQKKRKEYYLADLPFNRPYGWALFFSMLGIPWIILGVSAVNMCYRTIRAKQTAARISQEATSNGTSAETPVETTSESSANTQLETANESATKAVEIQTVYDFLHQQATSSAKKQKTRFVARVPEWYSREHDKELKSARLAVTVAERKLQQLGEEVKKAQRTLNQTKTDLRDLEAKIAHAKLSESTPESILEIWEEIERMRGVVNMTVPGTSSEQSDMLIAILVAVYVPYKGRVYDFGDYRIKIFLNRTFTCLRARSSTINGAYDYPDYDQGTSGFCFGDRRYEIAEYLERGDLIAAVTLIIDCLHSVNNEEDANRIPRTFAEVTSLKQIAKRFA